MSTHTHDALIVALLTAAAVVALCDAGMAQTLEVPNATFEDGSDGPDGWSLSGGEGRWLESGGTDGSRAIAVKGDGKSDNYWRSAPLAFEPSSVYAVRFWAKSAGATSGTATTGPIFCNRDLGIIPEEWKAYDSVFMTPEAVTPEQAWLRFGQWHVDGEIAYDNIEVTRLQPLYVVRDGFALGDGETVEGNEYLFAAPYYGESRNHSRPLHHHRCGFNTYRWVFGANSEVVYRHEIGERNQTTAAVNVSIGYYQSGVLAVEVSNDGEHWQEIAALGKEGKGGDLPIPESLLPARTIWVRLRAQAKERVGANSDPGSFQVSGYGYTATFDGPPASLAGRTQFVAVEQVDPRVAVNVETFGDVLPGGQNVVVARVENTTGKPIQARPTVTVAGEDDEEISVTFEASLKPGANAVEVPYEVAGAGNTMIRFTLGEQVAYAARISTHVAELFRADYGERLSSPSGDVALWWTSSGWKISRPRPAPTVEGEALLIRTARNEAEAAQLVVRREKALKGLMATATELTGPDGARIPAENVEVLRVHYLDVTRQTDRVGAIAAWPDPLPPLTTPFDVAAGENQPLWVRVKAPKDAASGDYTGSVKLTADGFEAEAPIRVHVYDFDLPDRMSCTTAFGFHPGLIFKYQKVSDPQQQREVVDKYLQNYSAHHITPYNPAPLDMYKVEWKGLDLWRGGLRDLEVKHSGEASRFVNDESTTGGVSAYYERRIAIPEGGFRLRFWYKTTEPGHQAIATLRHHDAIGQWMSGRNNDMAFKGNGEWQLFDKTISQFPAGAESVGVTLWATLYREDGSPTGGVWYDDFSLQDAQTGAELVPEGGFEPAESKPEPVFDWTAWDAAMERAMDELHFNSFDVAIPGLGSGTFHSRTDPSFLGYPESAPEYKAAMRVYCGAVQEHLREKGWLEDAYVYWFDEPDPKDYEFVMNGFGKLKKYCPGIGRMLTEQVEPELVGGPNIWCPVSSHYNHEDAEARRAEGDIFWWYVCTGPKEPYCTLFIDHPATELRVWLWQTWQRKIVGILIWQTNYWTSAAAYPDVPQNPYEDPMGWVSGYSTPAGTRRPWGNGDGRFVYPPEAAADGQQSETVLEGPVDSIRWEMLRDGIEDYEYLRMLRDVLEAKADRIPQAERNRYEDLLEVPERITADMTTFTKDPAPIEKRRHEIAEALEALMQR